MRTCRMVPLVSISCVRKPGGKSKPSATAGAADGRNAARPHIKARIELCIPTDVAPLKTKVPASLAACAGGGLADFYRLFANTAVSSLNLLAPGAGARADDTRGDAGAMALVGG